MGTSYRLARLLEMIALFRGAGRWRPKDLAAKFGISETRIYQDIRELRKAGIGISHTPDGYRTDEENFLPALNLTRRDVLELFYPNALFNDADTTGVEALRAKVLTALPKEDRDEIHRALSRTEIISDSTTRRDSTFETLLDAVANSRRVEMLYFDYRADRTSQRQLEPYGMVYRRRSWYCVGRCLKHKEVRKFRLNRIHEIKQLDAGFEPPEHFSLRDYMQDSWQLFDDAAVEVLIRFSPRVAPLVIERSHRNEQSIQSFSDGSIMYRAKVKGTDEIAWWLVQFGSDAEVLRPAVLRAKLLATARQIVRLYSKAVELPGPFVEARTAREAPPPEERPRDTS